MTGKPRLLAAVVCWAMAFAGHLSLLPAETGKVYTIGPEPSWVEPLPLPDHQDIPVDQVSSGIYVLLYDEQTRVTPRESYGQYARKILNETGVQQGSEIQIIVNSAYESVELHKVEILREGQWQQRLSPDIINVYQRETDMERYLLDGRHTLVIRLGDVRPGDVLRYSYTRRGDNPVMGGHFFASFIVRRSYPCARLRERILAPDGLALTVKNHHTDLAFTKKQTGEGLLYEWDASHLPPEVEEANVPRWASVYPWVEVSDMASWSDVVEWALPLYDFGQPLPGDLETEIGDLKNLPDTEKVRRALRIAQDQVRYFGTETGENSHKPRAPAVVYNQRFGDCKEKALLFCTILHRLGIEASPVLVSFSWGPGVRYCLPTPRAFDHVIVQAKVQGESFYLDPTSSYQRGPLRSLPVGDFGCGLVVSKGVSELTDIKPRAESIGRAVMEESLELPDMKSDAPGILKVHSTFSGVSAERQREQNATESRENLQDSYRRFYEQSFPGIKTTAPLRMVDHEERNIVEMWEEYQIPKVWKPMDKSNGVKVSVYSRDIAHYLENPGSTSRRFPLQISHPVDVDVLTQVKFPENWSIKPETIRENNDYFKFSQEISGSGKEARISTKFRTLQDHVPINNLEAYRSGVERASGSLGYVFSYQFPENSKGFFRGFLSIWPMVLTVVGAAYISVLGSLVIWLLGRHKPRRMCPRGEEHLDGLRGWLILVALGLIARPLVSLATLGEIAFPFLQNADLWSHFTSPGGTFYSPLWMPVFLFEGAVNASGFVFGILLLVLFFQKRRLFPTLFIAVLAFMMLMTLIDGVLVSFIPGEALTPEMRSEIDKGVSSSGQLFCSAALWIPYMLLSRRVKATFRR